MVPYVRMKLKFPHFIRIFSAAGLWVALCAVITVNLVNIPKAPTNVLGAFSNYEKEVRLKEIEKETIKNQYLFWQNVVKEKPDYRDGYIQLASLAYQLSNFNVAKRYLTQANNLDPNSPVVEKLTQVFLLSSESL